MLWHWLTRALRRPRRAAALPLPPVAAGQVAVTYAGHATALIRYANLAIVCDPMLGRWCRGVHREVLPGLSPAELGDVELILLSHSDPDHLHPPTLAQLPRSATVVLPQRAAQRVSHLGFARVVELGVGQSVQHRRVDVSTVAVRYGDARAPALGYVLRGDGPSVFFCGDSGYFSGFEEIGRRFRPDLALLPIGGYAPSSFRARHMSPLDALQAFEDLRARVLLPIRHGTFALSYEQVHDPERWLAELVTERHLDPYVSLLAPGESRVFVTPERARSHDDAGDEPESDEDDDEAADGTPAEPASDPVGEADPPPRHRDPAVQPPQPATLAGAAEGH